MSLLNKWSWRFLDKLEMTGTICYSLRFFLIPHKKAILWRPRDMLSLHSEWHEQCHPEHSRGISDYTCWLWLKHFLIKSDQSTAKRDFAFGREKRIRLQVSWFSSKKIALKVVMSDGLRCFDFAQHDIAIVNLIKLFYFLLVETPHNNYNV